MSCERRFIGVNRCVVGLISVFFNRGYERYHTHNTWWYLKCRHVLVECYQLEVTVKRNRYAFL